MNGGYTSGYRFGYAAVTAQKPHVCCVFCFLYAPKVNIEERTILDEKTMLATLQTIENPALHLAVHMSMILSLREGEILGLQPSDLDFDAADGRGTISVSKTIQRANRDALEKLDPKQVYNPCKTKSRRQQKSPVRRSLKPSS